jgi:hypothetical protein
MSSKTGSRFSFFKIYEATPANVIKQKAGYQPAFVSISTYQTF